MKRKGKGWWTVVFNAALVLLGILPAISETLADLYPGWMATKGVMIIGMVGLALRLVTNTPVGKSEAP